jgi:threonine-phosphate decarboxylase
MTGCGLDNVAVLWSLSKIFGLPGARAGFLIANEPVLSRFRSLMQPWSLNALAQAAVDFLGTHKKEVRSFIDETQHYLQGERREFSDAIASLPKLVCYPSKSSFLLLRLPPGLNAQMVCRAMAERRILIRNCHNFHGLSDRYIRVALKDRATNHLALERLTEIVDQAAAVN